jgi:hypothetical protein
MPRYLVERTYPHGVYPAVGEAGARRCRGIVAANRLYHVTWITSWVSAANARTFCVYDAPSALAIRSAARLNHLPVDRIIRVSVLDPYGYQLGAADPAPPNGPSPGTGR